MGEVLNTSSENQNIESVNKYNLRELIKIIEASHLSESGQNSLVKQITLSNTFLQNVERAWNKEQYNKMLKEYIELYNSIYNSINKIKIISIEQRKELIDIERKKMMLEFTHTMHLSHEQNNISKIDKWLWALSYMFNSLSSHIWWEEKVNWYSVRDIKSSNEYELRLYQQELIDDILWNENGFNKEYIQWFDSKKWWNYILEISELDNLFLEWNIDITKFDSILLANYLKYKKTSWDIKPESIIDDLWLNTTSELIKIWKWEKEWTWIAKQKLEEEGFWEVVEKILNIENIINYNQSEEYSNKAKLSIWLLNKSDITKYTKTIPNNQLIEFSKWNNSTSCPWFLSWVENWNEKFKLVLKEAKKAELEDLKKKWIYKNIKDILTEKQINISSEKIEKDSEELYNKIEEILTDPKWSCGLDIAIIIEEFFKDKYKINVTQKDRIKLSEATIWNNIKQLNERLEQIEKILSWKEKIEQNWFEMVSLSEKEKEKLIEEKEEIKRKLEELSRTQKISWIQSKDLDSYRTKIEQWKTKAEALNELYEESEEFKKIIDNYKQNINNIDIEFWKKPSFSKKQAIKETKINNETGLEQQIYNPELWNIQIKELNTTITLNENEQKLVKSNPEVLEKIVDFYKVLDKVWLGQLWNTKEQIFKSISNVSWIWFSIDWDYLNENETKIFLNSILTSVWEKQISNVFSIENFMAQFEILNWNQAIWEEAKTEKYWEEKVTKIESKFLHKFFPIWNVLWFKQTEFENSIK